ncbi:MAG: PfkB family carbohydrate kinase [Anaerolineae bacterium]|nr:PfkB family carbohydrate kinase [Anaerolineae bacterium]MDW8102899.1 PfkB family carbohydrate kinase [Anaerolineae bacterium]
MKQTPEFLVIGHVTKDLVPGGWTIGGTASYASITARNLGKRTAIVTCAGDDLALEEFLKGIEAFKVDSSTTTTFQNLYLSGARIQFIREVAGKIMPSSIPAPWLEVPIVLIGPVAMEVDEGIVNLFPNSLVGVTPQGWMRCWDDDGLVRYRVWEEAHRILPKVEALILSEEDVQYDLRVVEEYAGLVEILVLTQAEQGATLYWRGKREHFPARPARMVDPTGAGDVFAAAFLIRLHETGDPRRAARFANAVASFSVEAPGVSGIPDRKTVEEWMVRNGWE